jgi:hypothetical protein
MRVVTIHYHGPRRLTWRWPLDQNTHPPLSTVDGPAEDGKSVDLRLGRKVKSDPEVTCPLSGYLALYKVNMQSRAVWPSSPDKHAMILTQRKRKATRPCCSPRWRLCLTKGTTVLERL